MSYRDKAQYPKKNYAFQPELLVQVTPNDIYKWMAFKAYGKEDPGPNDNPTCGRSSSLMYYKKALSYFMPHRLMHWNFEQRSGNPTKSTDVNDLIKAVVKKEARQQGRKSQARRPFTQEEFIQLVTLCSQFRDPNIKYGIPALLKFAFHMIARLDDSCEMKNENLNPNPRYPETLLARLRWSKNVNDERDAPNQIVIGAMDPEYCVLLGLGLHLETAISEVSDQSQHLFHFGRATPKLANGFVSSALREKVLKHGDFKKQSTGNLGSHSVRKHASTHARRNGSCKDDVDFRGRWKKNARQQDKYTDVDLPYPDGKTSVALCIGGACKYVCRKGVRVTDEWIRMHIVPNISNNYDPAIALVLGRAVLWAAFNPETSEYVPANIRQRINTHYTDYVRGSLTADENPVHKVQLIASELEGVLFLDELVRETENRGVEEGQDENTAIPQLQQRTMSRNAAGALLAGQHEIRREVGQLRSEVDVMGVNHTRSLEIVNKNVNRLARRPGLQFRNQQRSNEDDDGAREAGETMALNARLSRNPRTLYLLWEEYTVGLNGFKAARLFTTVERGRSKHTYSKRKHVWDKISELIRAGYTADVAIDKMYKAYGESLPVTKIILAMIADQKNGGHPQLCV
jgi:hypothetical protein